MALILSKVTVRATEISDDDEIDFEAMTAEEYDEYINASDEHDIPQSGNVTLTQRQLTESDRHDDNTLECPISREELLITKQ